MRNFSKKPRHQLKEQLTGVMIYTRLIWKLWDKNIMMNKIKT
jgi:hypothetical protein